MIGRPRGCSESFSIEEASCRSSFRSELSEGMRSVITGLACVSVPVLSSSIVFTRPISSSDFASFTRIPRRAARPVPTMMAVGVARPSEHGQAITRTEIAIVTAKERSLPRTSHTIRVTRAIPITIGTKIAATLSARRAIGALVEVASSTSAMMRESVESLPTRVTSTVRWPDFATDAPVTSLPGVFSTGSDSPVTTDSSTQARPVFTRPSAGMVSPALTARRSPTCTESIGTVTSAPLRITVAIEGRSFARAVTASVAFDLARDSIYLPTETSVGTIAAESRYRLPKRRRTSSVLPSAEANAIR